MKLTIDPEIILRVPQFHLDAILHDEWEELKNSIKLSSNDFYQTIENVSAAELEQLPRSTYHSIWKYFNRAKFRATPYGSFAGFGLIEEKQKKEGKVIQVSSLQVLHKYICWTEHMQYAQHYSLTEATLLFANSSYYKVMDRIRFLIKTQNQGFELSEVEALPEVISILSECRSPVSFSKLINQKYWNLDKTNLLKEMIGLQLIFTDAIPNIIGEDYFKRRKIKILEQTPQYILAERKVIDGYPDQHTLQHIPGLLVLMNNIVEEFESFSLNNFRSKFETKFENRFISLMNVLDPETGISYSNNEYPIREDGFINFFEVNPKTSIEDRKHVFETLLINSNRDKKTIRLESVLNSFPSPDLKLPNTMTILCSIVDGNLIIENIGGSTATAVLGRYSICSEGARKLCQKLALLEQNANPDVLFFDIAYTSELFADNINRRPQIYPYQLSIMNFDTSNDPITLDDLYVTSNGKEIMLFSKKHNKRMIPRLSSAYNYNRSDLAIFRFLCDLQHQGLKPNLGFIPSDLVPDLDYYPRVQYQNIIMAPAKWKVSLEALKKHISTGAAKSIKTYLNELGMDGYVLVRTEDRTMCFNIESEPDLIEFHYLLKKFKQFYLEEGFLPKAPIVKDHKQHGYANQFVLSICNNKTIYNRIPIHSPNLGSLDHPQIFPPGTEWLYYEIYTDPYRAETLLQEQISSFLKKYKNKIQCWFFIRFTEGGNHIRLRMKLKKIDDLGLIMSELARCLQKEINSGVISEFKINKYVRETERYTVELIEDVEQVFFKDSQFVVLLLNQGIADRNKYQICIDLLLKIKDSSVIDVNCFDQMIQRTSDYFLTEHGINGDGFKRLNGEYKVFKGLSTVSFNKSLKKQLTDFALSFINILSRCPQHHREVLFTDLMHMHINRLFSTKQRTHEMVVYYFMVKKLQYERALLNRRTASI